jgi:hypothetical protein
MLRCRVNADQLHRLAVVIVVGNHVAGLCVGHREERREVGGVDDPACVQGHGVAAGDESRSHRSRRVRRCSRSARLRRATWRRDRPPSTAAMTRSRKSFNGLSRR